METKTKEKRTIRKMTVLLLSAVMILSSVVYVFAAAEWSTISSSYTKWGGYLVERWNTNNKRYGGMNTAYMYINTSKDGGKTNTNSYIQFKISPYTDSDWNGTAKYNTIKNTQTTWTLANYGSDVVRLPSGIKSASTTKYPLTGGSASFYAYINVPVEVQIPRGYIASRQFLGQDKTRFPTTWLGEIMATNTASSNNIEFANAGNPNRGPFAADTYVTAYTSYNVGNIGMTTRPEENGTGYYDRYYTTLNIEFTPNKTTVSYNANTGVGSMSDQTVTYDTATTLTSNAFIKPGYHFVGWNTKADGSGTTYANKAAVTTAFPTEKNVTLYAQWAPNNYTLAFNPMGGEANAQSVTVTQDSNVNANSGVTAQREGYRFKGWYTSPAGGDQVYDEDGIASNYKNSGHWDSNGQTAKWKKPYAEGKTIPLYAQWVPDSEGAYVTVVNETHEEVTIPTLKIKKTDEATGNPLQGAVFTLSGTNYNEERTTETDGMAVWENIPDGTYTLTETGVPSGYKTLADVNDEVHMRTVVVTGGKVKVFAEE